MPRKLFVVTKVVGGNKFRISSGHTSAGAKKFVGEARKAGLKASSLTKTQGTKLIKLSRRKKITLSDISAVKRKGGRL